MRFGAVLALLVVSCLCGSYTAASAHSTHVQGVIDSLLETSSTHSLAKHSRTTHHAPIATMPAPPSKTASLDDPNAAKFMDQAETDHSLDKSLDDPKAAGAVDTLDQPQQKLSPGQLDDPNARSMAADDTLDGTLHTDDDVGKPVRSAGDGSRSGNNRRRSKKWKKKHAKKAKSGTTEVVITDNANVIRDSPKKGEVQSAMQIEKAVKKQQAQDMKAQQEETKKSSSIAADEMKFKKTEDEQMDERKSKFTAAFTAEVDEKNKKRRENWAKQNAQKKNSDEEEAKATKAAIDAIEGDELSQKQRIRTDEQSVKSKIKETEQTSEQTEEEETERHQKAMQKEQERYEDELDNETDQFKKENKEKQEKANEEYEKKKKEMEEADREQMKEQAKKNQEAAEAEKQKLAEEEKNKQQDNEAAEKRTAEAQRQLQEQATKKAQEQAEKQDWNVKGMCAFSAHGEGGCPNGWRDLDWGGLITNTPNDGNLNPFSHGAQFNSGWWWSHPRLCCAVNDYPELNGRIYMLGGDDCLDRKGLFGIIKTAGDYHQSPFHAGGDFNGAWRWTHPFMCKIHGDKVTLYRHRKQNKRLCMLSMDNECRGRFNSDRGFVGIIVPNASNPPMNIGSGFNPWWKWAHPHLCCSF